MPTDAFHSNKPTMHLLDCSYCNSAGQGEQTQCCPNDAYACPVGSADKANRKHAKLPLPPQLKATIICQLHLQITHLLSRRSGPHQSTTSAVAQAALRPLSKAVSAAIAADELSCRLKNFPFALFEPLNHNPKDTYPHGNLTISINPLVPNSCQCQSKRG